MYEYRITQVLHVVDGDTVDVLISLGFGLSAALRIRLADVDTYELRDSPRGPCAKQFTQNWLDYWAGHLAVRTSKGAPSAIGIGDGAFGRWLGTIYPVDEQGQAIGESLSAELKSAGHHEDI